MTVRTLPNLGLRAFYELGEDGWKDDQDLGLLKLSVLVQARALDKVAAEPGAPTLGDVIVLDETNVTNPNAIAVWDGETGSEAWVYMDPLEGWMIYIESLTEYQQFDGAEWVSAGSAAVVMATAAEVNSGTDTTKVINPAVLSQSNYGKKVIEMPCTDPNGAALTVGNGQGYFVVPPPLNGMNLVAVAAALVGAQSTSGTPTIMIANQTDAVDMLSTPLTIDANEWTSYTAATAAVIDATKDDVATGDIIRIDVDVAGTGAKGLIVILTFQLP